MENLRGALLMTAAMAAFALEDAFVKAVADDMSLGQIILVLSAAGMVIFWAVARARGRAVFDATLLNRAVLTRNAGELIGTVGYVGSLTLIPLSLASAILMATPLAVTLGAVLWFGETVGWRRWTAIVVGLLGVLLVLQPGLAGFRPEAFLALVGVVGLTMRDLATRRAPATLDTMQLSASAFATLIPVGLVLMLASEMPAVVPQGWQIVHLAGAVVFGLTGYMLIVAAMRIGEVSYVTAFRYTRILFALAIGVVVFGERPNPLTFAGIAVIVAAGLYILLRERRLTHLRRRRPTA